MIRYGKPELITFLPPARGVVQASAGTGKTFTLERMVVDFLLTGTPLEQILVVTFTEKAALELRARIRKMLDTLVNLTATPEDAQAPFWTLDEAARALLQAALRSFDRATIATIHGFCRKLLVESAFEGGALLSQELADGKQLFQQAYRDRVRLRFNDTPGCGALFLEALQAMTAAQIGDLLYEAHQDRGVQQPPYRDLAADLAAFRPEWLAAPEALDQAWVDARVHALTLKAARGRLPAFRKLMDQAPSPFAFLAACDIDPIRTACLALADGPGLELGQWLDRLSPDSHGLTATGLLVHSLLPSVRARVRELKDAEGLFDHDDTILQVHAALRSPTAGTLVARIAERYRIALIDEFQDTDQAQWEIFERLFSGEDQRFYVIGDPKQAIYGFRGGDLPTYRQAAATLLQGKEPLVLTSNFRSTPELIEACNELFTGGLEDQRFFQDPTTYPADQAVRCGNKALHATTRDGRAVPPVRILQTGRFKGRNASETLADALARELKDIVAVQGLVLHDPKAKEPEDRVRTLHYGDVQVLVGSRKEGRLMAAALGRIGVPSTLFKQKGLFASEEARDLLDVLCAVERPLDPGRRARALLTPFFGHRLQDLDRIGALPDDHAAIRQLQHWQKLGEQRQFHLMLESMLSDSGLILRLCLRTGSERALTNHLHLAELLSTRALPGAADLEGLVRLLRRWISDQEKPAGEDSDLQRVEGQDRTVQILTLHISKGLEAGIVAVFAFNPGLMNPRLHRFHLGNGQRAYTVGSKNGPYQAQIKEEEAGEQERLMYVGLTRAKALLILPCAVVNTAKGKPSHPQSAYKVVNRRLRPVADQGTFRPDLFQRCTPDLPEQRDRSREQVDLSGWRMPPCPDPEAPDYANARQQAWPSFTTSYTQLERILKQQAAPLETILADREPDAPEATASAGDVLPRGSQTGQAIHELIEAEDCAQALAQGFAAWWESPARKEAVRSTLAGHGLEPRWDGPAARMVHAALTVPLPNRDGSAAPLGVHDLLLREVAFLSRFEETGDFLEGYMDAVYVRDGLTSFLDWKTNTVPPYSPDVLAAFFEEHFAIQAKIYTLVLLDHLHLDDEASYERGFGGIHYVFLRATLPALHSFRPSWTQIQAWRQDLQTLHTKVAHV